MGSEWKELTIDDIKSDKKYSCVGGPFGSSLSRKHYTESGVPVIRGVNLSGDDFKDSDFVYVSEEKADELYRNTAYPGDIVFTQRGTLGQVALIPHNALFSRYIVSQSQMKLTVDSQKADPYFIYSLFRTKAAKKLIEASAIVGGVPHINLGILKEFKLRLPSIKVQRRINAVATSLDNKITLNRQINQTLEQMAQALFKSWFVDFDPVIDNALAAGNPIPDELQPRADQRKALRLKASGESDSEGYYKPLPESVRALFPDTFEESELGWVPKGWANVSTSELIELIGGGTPKTKIEEYWGGDIPWFSVVDAPNNSDVFVFSTEKNVTELGVKNSSTKVLRPGTTIISARGTVGKCALVAVPMAMNQSCYGVIGANGLHDNFVYYLLRHSVSLLKQRSHGSVFSTITRDTFKTLTFPFAGADITDVFGEFLEPWFSRIKSNNLQNVTLTNLRDTLLPKLISGELQLDQLPDVVASVA